MSNYSEYEQIASKRATTPWYICQEFARPSDYRSPSVARQWLNLWTTESADEAEQRWQDELFYKGRHLRLLKVENVHQTLT